MKGMLPAPFGVKQVTGQIPSEKKTVRRTVFRERVTLHYSYAHAAASEVGSFGIIKECYLHHKKGTHCRKRQRAMGLRNNTKVIVPNGFAVLPECSSCAGISPERCIAHLRSSQYRIPFGRSFSCILTRQKAKSHKAISSTSKRVNYPLG